MIVSLFLLSDVSPSAESTLKFWAPGSRTASDLGLEALKLEKKREFVSVPHAQRKVWCYPNSRLSCCVRLVALLAAGLRGGLFWENRDSLHIRLISGLDLCPHTHMHPRLVFPQFSHLHHSWLRHSTQVWTNKTKRWTLLGRKQTLTRIISNSKWECYHFLAF